MVALGPVARAEQVEPGDAAALVGVGVGLLLDGEPAAAEPLRRSRSRQCRCRRPPTSPTMASTRSKP